MALSQIPNPYSTTWQAWVDTLVGFNTILVANISPDEDWQEVAERLSEPEQPAGDRGQPQHGRRRGDGNERVGEQVHRTAALTAPPATAGGAGRSAAPAQPVQSARGGGPARSPQIRARHLDE